MEDGDALNETTLTSSLIARWDSRFGQIAIGFRGRSNFDELFEDYSYTRAGPFISMRPLFGDKIGLSVEGEYRFSERPNARRFLINVRGRIPLSKFGKAGGMNLIQEFRVSMFRAGGNAGRRDLRSSTTLQFVPDLKLAGGFALAFNATLFQNFSTQSTRRYTDFEIGPRIALGF